LGAVIIRTSDGDGTEAGHLLAVSATTGADLWSQPIRDLTQASVFEPIFTAGLVLSVDTTINTDENVLYGVVKAFDARTGALRWTVDAGVGGATMAVADGTAYMASQGQLEAVTVGTGQVRWTVPSGGTTLTPPAVAGGRVYLLAYQGRAVNPSLFVFDATTGALQKSVELPARTGENIVVDDGRILLGCDAESDNPGRLYALDAVTAVPLWNVELPWLDFGPSGRPVATGQFVMIGDTVGNAAALDVADGSPRWFLPAPQAPEERDNRFAALSGDLLVTGNTGRSAALISASDGRSLGGLPIAGTVSDGAGPAIVGNRVFLVSGNILTAFGN
jgi:outer membrane protein assembly factor BamB